MIGRPVTVLGERGRAAHPLLPHRTRCLRYDDPMCNSCRWMLVPASLQATDPFHAVV